MNAVSFSKDSVKTNNLSFIYVILVVVASFSLLYGWVPILHKFLYLCIIGCFLSLLLVPRYYRSKIAFYTFLYSIVVVINFLMGDAFAFDRRLLDGAIMLFSTSCLFYVMKSGDNQMKKWTIILVLSVLIIQTFISVPINLTRGGLIREMFILQYRGESQYDWDSFYRLGLVNYDMIHALPIIIPPIVMWLRTSDLKKSWFFFLLLSLVCILLLAFVYESTTVQLLSFWGLTASFLVHKTSRMKSNQRITFLFIIVFPLLLSESIEVDVLRTVENAQWGELSKKAGDIRIDIQNKTQDSDMSNRSELYNQSLDEFWSNPIMGTNNSNNLGRHSAIFDRMGAFGLVGIIPYVIVVLLVIVYVNKSLPKDKNKWYYYLSAFSFVTILLLKDMNKIEVWLMFCVLVPSLLTIDKDMKIHYKSKNAH